MLHIIKCLSVSILSLFFITVNAATSNVRLYTLNCGTLDIQDQASFSDTGLYPHQPTQMADPCFLIKHDNTWMLWDLGLGDQYVGHPAHLAQFGVTLIVPVSLVSQLKQLNLTTSDIKYVGLSHAHFDHTGNADLFPHATWLLQRAEYQAMQQDPLPIGVTSNLFKILQPVNKILLTSDYDVFGDGTVVILSTPGHTVGHQSLELKLQHKGVIILSGDLYHLRKAYRFKQVPVENYSRADTLASMARVDSILHNTHGHLVIQHDIHDSNSMLKFPKYLY